MYYILFIGISETFLRKDFASQIVIITEMESLLFKVTFVLSILLALTEMYSSFIITNQHKLHENLIMGTVDTAERPNHP